MGKHHRVLKKARLISDFRWTANRLEFEFNEDLDALELRNIGWCRCGNKKKSPGPPPISVAVLLSSIEEIGFYRICTLNRLLSAELDARERQKQRWMQSIAFALGGSGISRKQFFELAVSLFPCTNTNSYCSARGHVHRDAFEWRGNGALYFLENLFIDQLQRLEAALPTKPDQNKANNLPA